MKEGATLRKSPISRKPKSDVLRMVLAIATNLYKYAIHISHHEEMTNNENREGLFVTTKK
jgi:hypothetical protein